jgi:hypothetical protein
MVAVAPVVVRVPSTSRRCTVSEKSWSRGAVRAKNACPLVASAHSTNSPAAIGSLSSGAGSYTTIGRSAGVIRCQRARAGHSGPYTRSASSTGFSACGNGRMTTGSPAGSGSGRARVASLVVSWPRPRPSGPRMAGAVMGARS